MTTRAFRHAAILAAILVALILPTTIGSHAQDASPVPVTSPEPGTELPTSPVAATSTGTQAPPVAREASSTVVAADEAAMATVIIDFRIDPWVTAEVEGTCFDFLQDAGGVPGAPFRVGACPQEPDSLIILLPAGSYWMIPRGLPLGVVLDPLFILVREQDLDYDVLRMATYYNPGSPLVTVTARTIDGVPVTGTCVNYSINPIGPYNPVPVCDIDDGLLDGNLFFHAGSELMGLITIVTPTNWPAGADPVQATFIASPSDPVTVSLVATWPSPSPSGSGTATSTRTPSATPSVTWTPTATANVPAATVTFRFWHGDGSPAAILSACAVVYPGVGGAPGKVAAAQACDTARTGAVSVTLPPGNYIVETKNVPAGSVVDPLAFAILPGQAQRTIDLYAASTKDVLGAISVVNAIGVPIAGICLTQVSWDLATQLRADSPCDGDDGILDGVVRMRLVPVASVLLACTDRIRCPSTPAGTPYTEATIRPPTSGSFHTSILVNAAAPTATAWPTATWTPSATPTRTSTATRTPTRTATPTITRTPSRTPTATLTRTVTRTPTPTLTRTVTRTATVTRTSTHTLTPTATRTPTPPKRSTVTGTPTPKR